MEDVQTTVCVPLKSYVTTSSGNKWKAVSAIGEGMYGTVWQACLNDQECQYVLKYMPFKSSLDPRSIEDIKKEIEIQQAISKFDLAIPVIDSWFCEDGGVLVMRSLKKTVSALLEEYKTIKVRLMILGECLGLIAKLHRYQYYHGDLHLSNIMVNYTEPANVAKTSKNEYSKYKSHNYKYYLIDFGFAGNFPDFSQIRNDYRIMLESILDESERDESLSPLYAFLRSYVDTFYSEA